MLAHQKEKIIVKTVDSQFTIETDNFLIFHSGMMLHSCQSKGQDEVINFALDREFPNNLIDIVAQVNDFN